MLPPLLPCCSLNYPGWQHFFRFSPVSPPFRARRLQLLCDFLRFFTSLPPSSILLSFPLSSSPFPFPLQSSLPSPFPSPFPSDVRLWVPTPVPVPAPSPLPSPSPFPLRPRPHERSRPRYPVSVPTPNSNPAPDPVRSFLPLGSGYPPGTMRLYRRRALRMGPSGARKRHPLSAEMATRAE